MTVSTEAREEAIENKLERRGDSGLTYRLALDGEPEPLPVVNLNLKNVVLNPKNHRIKAQVRSHPKSGLLEQEPFCEESQREFAKMLRQTDRYERLRENLREEGQREPGVVTQKGLLVNANRRVTALREIKGEQHVRVAVLPPGITPEEILDVEANLQVREDYRAEYTYTNQLLLIEEMLNDFGRSEEDVALDLGYADSRAKNHLDEGVNKVKKYLRELSIIREARQISNTDGSPKVDWVFFDDKQQIVSEIAEDYREVKKKKGWNYAERLKMNRLIGLFIEYKYRELREVGYDFVNEVFVESAQERQDRLSVDFPVLMEAEENELDGPERSEQQELNLDLLGEQNAEEEDSPVFDARPLVDLLAQSHGDDTVEVPTGDGERETLSRDRVVEDTWEVLERATDRAENERKEESLLEYPIERTREAASKLRRARLKYEEVCEHPDFDSKLMEEKICKVEDALRKLQDSFGNM